MGTGSTPKTLRGLLIPDPRVTWDTFSSTSVLTQAGPLPGVPASQNETEMVLEAVGSQDADNHLRIKTVRAGHPGVDAARFVWRKQGDPVDEYRGWDPPLSISGFEFVNRSTTSDRWRSPHVLALKDGRIAIACVKDLQIVTVWFRSPVTGTWTETEVYDYGSSFGISMTPCLVELPNGRLLCFFWHEQNNLYQIRNYYTDDTTWTPAQKGVLPTPIDGADYIPNRFRCAYLNGQICMIMWLTESATPEDQLFQYASNDLGSTFDLVADMTGINRGFPDILAHKGKLILAYITTNSVPPPDAANPPAFRILGSAYEDFTSASSGYCQSDYDPMEWASVAVAFGEGDLALWSDEDGALYVMGRDHAGTTNDCSIRVSHDDGSTWTEVANGPAAHSGESTWRGQDANTYPVAFSGCMHRGRAFVAHTFAANPGTADDSLSGMWLGGYTTVCLPQESSVSTSPLAVAGWTVTWLPYDYPEDIGNTVPVWTASSTGSPSLTSSGMRFLTGNPQTEYRMSNNITSTLAQGLIALFEAKLVDGQCRMELRISDNTPLEYEIACILSETEIKLWDLKAGAIVGAAVATTDATTGFVQVLVDIYNDNAKMWYRVVNATGDRHWIEVASTGTLTSAALNSGNRIRFGQVDDSDSYWKLVCYANSSYTEEHIYGQDNWSELLGRAYVPTPIFVDAGVKVQAVDGPTFRSDDWDIDTRYTYGVENIHPEVSPSPRRSWRSTADGVDVELVWDFGVGVTAITNIMGPLLGVHLEGANFGKAEIWGKNVINTWVKIADLNLAAQTGLTWTRKDRIVLPDLSGGNAVPYYMPTHILAGSHFVLTEQEGNVVQKIETNSGGTWLPGSSTLAPRILLEALSGTENTSGTTGEIWIKDYTGVVPLSAAYKAFKLIIPAQKTCEGYFEIGAFQLGTVHVFGQDYGWGRSQEWAADWEKTEGRTGIRAVKKLGPVRRAVEFAWADGVDVSDVTKASPNPDWTIGWTGGEPVAALRDTPYLVAGMYEFLAGAVTPVVYLPVIPYPSSGSAVANITNRATQLYGRVVTETLKMDTVMGDEWTGPGEVIRMGTVRIEEEV
jgi:hypothetical protein